MRIAYVEKELRNQAGKGSREILMEFYAGRRSGCRASCGHNSSFLALPQSWIAGASRVPPYRVQGAERAGGQRGCGGALTRFPRNRSCKRESKDQPGVWI